MHVMSIIGFPYNMHFILMKLDQFERMLTFNGN